MGDAEHILICLAAYAESCREVQHEAQRALAGASCPNDHGARELALRTAQGRAQGAAKAYDLAASVVDHSDTWSSDDVHDLPPDVPLHAGDHDE